MICAGSGLRVRESGPAAPAADLSLVGTPRAARLRAALARTAHLLAPTDPAQAVVDVLHSRLAGDPDWGPQVAALRESCARGLGWSTAGRCRTCPTRRCVVC